MGSEVPIFVPASPQGEAFLRRKAALGGLRPPNTKSTEFRVILSEQSESKDPFPVVEEYGFFDYAALWAAPLRMTYSVQLLS